MAGTTISARRSTASRLPTALLRLRGDDDLQARAREGDERAFELLYERHLPGVLSFCRHLLGDPAEAEDAVQHAFAAAYRELRDEDRPLRLKSWLYTVARNRCLSIRRDRREYATEIVEPSTAGLSDEVQRRADVREVLADLHDLPEDQRAALVLAELDALSHAEIAGVLGCEAGQVKGLVFRARAGLMERHEAREASCEDIRAELAVARRGGLRRSRLKHHLKACPGCAAYLEDLRRQRSALALLLPVAPTAGLKPSLLASLGIGGGAAAGGLAAAGTAGTAAAIAVAAAVGGAGLAGQGSPAPESSGSERAAPPAQSAPVPARGALPAPAALRGAVGAAPRSRSSQARARGRARAAASDNGRIVRARGGGEQGKGGKPEKKQLKQHGPKPKVRPARPRPASGALGNGGARNGATAPGRAKAPGSPATPKAKARSRELPAVAQGGAGKKPK